MLADGIAYSIIPISDHSNSLCKNTTRHWQPKELYLALQNSVLRVSRVSKVFKFAVVVVGRGV